MEDLNTIRGRILPNFKVNDLKMLIKTINEQIRPTPSLKLSGNKKELSDRIDQLLLDTNSIGNPTTIRLLRCIINWVYSSCPGTFPSFFAASPSMTQQVQPRIAAPSTTTTLSAGRPSTGTTISSGTASSSTINPALVTRPGSTTPTTGVVPGHHHHYQHRAQSQHDIGSSSSSSHMALGISSPFAQSATRTFKPSPFYKELETLCPPRLCVEAKERTMNVTLQFTTTPTLSARMKSDPELQIMIFCGWADTPPGQQILMEFPSVCEVKVNQRNLEANLRGMKNKPGTVAPGNITRLCRLEPTGFNRVDFVYVNTTKKYNVSLHLVKRTSVEKIIQGIQQGKFLSKERMLQIIADRNRDADVVVSASTLSLKCPLGFMRINIPCRSSYCHHLQCFDGYTFFNLNEQTPTWTCPVCSRVMLSWEEIVVDGYFTDILESTPASLESVSVQPDGSWEIPSSLSSASGKNGASVGGSGAGESQKTATPAPEAVTKKKPPPSDVFVLDDDDDEEEVGTSSGHQSPSTPRHLSQPPPPPEPRQPTIEIIDLISDSEEEPDQTEEMERDDDGDTVMQAAAHSLQDMASSGGGKNPATTVKAEAVEPTAVATEASGPASTQPSATVAGASSAPTRVVSPAPVSVAAAESSSRGSSERSPQSTTSSSANTSENHSRAASASAPGTGVNGWDANEQDAFMHQLIGTNRRKRQYEVDSEMQNMTAEARQRISRMELHSRASSERGGSTSAVQSPDASAAEAARSTSSPSPAIGGSDDAISTRHVHQDRISSLIYDNLNAAAVATAVASSSSVPPPDATVPGGAATTTASSTTSPIYSTPSPHAHSYSHSQPQHQSHGQKGSNNGQSYHHHHHHHYRSSQPLPANHQHARPSSSTSNYSTPPHMQSRPAPSEYYSGYSRATSTDHVRAASTTPMNSSNNSSNNSSVTAQPMGWSSGSSGGGWRSGSQESSANASTWPNDLSSSRPMAAVSNGMYSSPPPPPTSNNPYAPRMVTLEEIKRSAGITGYAAGGSSSSSSSSSPSRSSPSPYHSSSLNVTAHPQQHHSSGGSYSRHPSAGYAPPPPSSSGGNGSTSRRGYEYRDASQSSSYAHRPSSGGGSGGGGYTHGRSHSNSTPHGYEQQRRDNGMIAGSGSSRRGSVGYGDSGGAMPSMGNGHPQQHHHQFQHQHQHQQHHSGNSGSQYQHPHQHHQQQGHPPPTDDFEEEEEVVEQGYGRPVFFQGLRGARAR